MKINVDGQSIEAQKLHVAVDGVWQTAQQTRIAVDGAWQADARLGSIPKLRSLTATPATTEPYTAITFTFGQIYNATGEYPKVRITERTLGRVGELVAAPAGTFTWKGVNDPKPITTYTFTVEEDNGTGGGYKPRPDLATTVTMPELPAPTSLTAVTAGQNPSSGNPLVQVSWDSQANVGIKNYLLHVDKYAVNGVGSSTYKDELAFVGEPPFQFDGTPGADYTISVAGAPYTSPLVLGKNATIRYSQSRGYAQGWYVFTGGAATWHAGKQKWVTLSHWAHGGWGIANAFTGVTHTSVFYWQDEANNPFATINNLVSNYGARVTKAKIKITNDYTPLGNAPSVFAQLNWHRSSLPVTNGTAPNLIDNRVAIGTQPKGWGWHEIPLAWESWIRNGCGITLGNWASASQPTLNYFQMPKDNTRVGQLAFWLD